MNDITIIKKIFRMRTIAVVGMSQKPERPSNFVALYMQDKGYEIIPVTVSYTHLTLPTTPYV